MTKSEATLEAKHEAWRRASAKLVAAKDKAEDKYGAEVDRTRAAYFAALEEVGGAA